MKPIRDFDEFVKRKIVKRQTPDKSRALSLKKEAENSYSFLQNLLIKIKINEENANDYVKLCYNILMELIRARMFLDGFKASGYGAHEAEVSYLRVLKFKASEVQFTNQLRYFRNGMLYYGKTLDREYADKVIEFLKKMYNKLK